MEARHRPRSSALRKGRHSEVGQVYLVTTSTRDRRPLFRDFATARHAIRALRHHDETGDVTTLAYVLMPDHLHWLLRLDTGTLDQLLRRFKGFSGFVVARMARRAGLIWESGYHDRAVRREEDLQALARYVVANPLRAGLVERIGDYPHWDAIWL